MSVVATNLTNSLSIADLRDYLLPAPIPLLPLAPWAWVTLAIVTLAVISVGTAAYMRHRRNAYRRAGMALLAAGSAAPQTGASSPREINQLLKRVALAAYGRSKAASLYGQEWVEFLRAAAPTVALPVSVSAFLTAPDETLPSEGDHDRVLTFAREWIKRHGPLPDQSEEGRQHGHS